MRRSGAAAAAMVAAVVAAVGSRDVESSSRTAEADYGNHDSLPGGKKKGREGRDPGRREGVRRSRLHCFPIFQSS